MKLKNIFTFLFASIAVIFEAYFGVLSIVSFFIQLILVSIIAAMFMKILPSGKNKIFSRIAIQMALFISATIGFLLSIFLSFVAYHNFFPGKLSDITVSSEKQTVVFLQMSHIATSEFYTEKKKIIQDLQKQGYVFLVEGVQPGTADNEKKFSESLGFNFTPTLYTSIASFIGLEAQDNTTLFSGISTGSLVSVDISIDDLVNIIGTGSLSGSGQQGDIVDIEGQLATLDSARNQEKLFVGYVVRSIMNLVLKQTTTLEDVMMLGTDPRVFDAILGKRNDALIQYIENHPDKKIAVVYGGLHFSGVFAAIQQKDPTWKITNITSYTPYNE